MSNAPTPSTAPALLRVFLDCDRCDTTYLRTEITFVDYMRDRSDADVHVLVTTEGTGGGGTSWTMKFIGQNAHAGDEHVVTFTTAQTATSDIQRKEIARVLKIGLVAYAAGTPAIDSLNVTYTKPTTTASTVKKKDPWNYWVFRVSANGNLNGEESSNNKRYSFNASASRTTENWKMSFSTNRNESRSSYDLGDGDLFKSKSSSWSASGLIVKSAGPRLSFGMRSSSSGSIFSNQNYNITVMPGAEFDVFPYKESTRRSLTFTYAAGLAYYNYRDITIFDKLTEAVPQHSAGASLGMQQPWGSLGASVNYSQQLRHPDRYSLGLSGNADVRLFKGFSFNVFGDYSRIRDQISLRKGTASNEDVLLRLRQIQSGYSYYVGFGFSYSFGSIFNSIVNPRYGGGGGRTFFFF